NSIEPPCTDPYARWCGRGGAARLPPIPLNSLYIRLMLSFYIYRIFNQRSPRRSMGQDTGEQRDESYEGMRVEVLRLRRLGMNALDIWEELGTFPLEATRIIHDDYAQSNENALPDLSEMEGLLEIAMQMVRRGCKSPPVPSRARVVMDISDPRLRWDPCRLLREFQHHARRQRWPTRSVQAALVASMYAMARRV